MYKTELLNFPQAILHIDGDSFFASCEVAKRPHLKGLPVVTGRERGIASAMTYEAKRMGVKRGMSIGEIKKICPRVIILPSDYEAYSLYSKRMYEIVKRYTPEVEEYSIDECFADLTGLRRLHKCSYLKMTERIKEDLQKELGITFSLGLASTKVLAKIASKWDKPDGLTTISLRDSLKFLRKTEIEKIWGIGQQTSALLRKYGVRTAYDFVNMREGEVRKLLSKPYYEIWQELRGISVYKVERGEKDTYKSISKTRTFTPPSSDRERVFAELSKNIENACIKARRYNLKSKKIFLFLKNQEFKYRGLEIRLERATNTPINIVKETKKIFDQVFDRRDVYRATGIVLGNLEEDLIVQESLFGESGKDKSYSRIYGVLDKIGEKYGKHTLYLGSSYKAINRKQHRGERGERAEGMMPHFKGENMRKRINIPYLGEVG